MRFRNLWAKYKKLVSSQSEDYKEELHRAIREEVYDGLFWFWDGMWVQEKNPPKSVTFTETIVPDGTRITFELGLEFIKCYIEVRGRVESFKKPLLMWHALSIMAYNKLQKMREETA